MLSNTGIYEKEENYYSIKSFFTADYTSVDSKFKNAFKTVVNKRFITLEKIYIFHLSYFKIPMSCRQLMKTTFRWCLLYCRESNDGC